jgi:transposase InsO family protein
MFAPQRRIAVQLSPCANGCIERFFRTLKEQLLWIRHFRDLEELRAALIEFRTRYNHQWILQQLGGLGSRPSCAGEVGKSTPSGFVALCARIICSACDAANTW